jgi:hypothetical protein
METHTENTHYLASVKVVVAANVTPLEAPEIKNIVARRLELRIFRACLFPLDFTWRGVRMRIAAWILVG